MSFDVYQVELGENKLDYMPRALEKKKQNSEVAKLNTENDSFFI